MCNSTYGADVVATIEVTAKSLAPMALPEQPTLGRRSGRLSLKIEEEPGSEFALKPRVRIQPRKGLLLK